jgi:hypothetical protein
MSREATERRLRADGFARLEPDEEIVAWCRAWVSRAGILQRIAARWRDVAVVTDRRLLLFSVGPFSRRPRRRLLADRLDELTVADVGTHPGRGLRCARPGRPPMLVELGADAWSRKVALELQTRASGSQTATGGILETESPAAPATAPATAPVAEPAPDPAPPPA